MWSRFDTVEVELVQRRRARGLTIAGIQRVIMPTDWGEKYAPVEGRMIEGRLLAR
jgi:hypothetical protein